MTSRGKKNKADDKHNDLSTVKSKKAKVSAGETDGKGDRKVAWSKDSPAIAGDSKMHELLKDTANRVAPKMYHHLHSACWHCGKLCPATSGYCFSCLLFVSSEDIDKHPLPRKILLESPVVPPVSTKEFFALLMTGLLRSTGRVTQMTQRKDAPPELPLSADPPKPTEYTLVTHKLTENFVSSLMVHLQRAKGLLSSTVMQLQIDVTRGFSGDLFTFTYRSPTNPESTRLPFSREAGSPFQGFMACRTHFFVDQDNDEDKKLGLGHGQIEVPRGFFFGTPLSEASLEATTVCTLMQAMLDGFKSNMADLQLLHVQHMLDDAEPLDDTKLESLSVRTSAPVIKQQKLSEVFAKLMAPVLDFCIVIGMGRVLPQLLGDTPGHNMEGDKKTVIFNLF